MKFYSIETLGETNDPDLCIIDAEPDGMGMKGYYLNFGIAARDIYPQNATVNMNPEEPGTKICDVVGNTLNCLIVTERIKILLEKLCDDIEVEYLPLTLLNHTGGVHRGDLFIVNPIGTFDCLDRDASDISYEPDGDIIDIDDYILDPEKARSAPSLFRLAEKPDFYIIRQDALEALEKANIENLMVSELEFSA